MKNNELTIKGVKLAVLEERRKAIEANKTNVVFVLGNHDCEFVKPDDLILSATKDTLINEIVNLKTKLNTLEKSVEQLQNVIVKLSEYIDNQRFL